MIDSLPNHCWLSNYQLSTKKIFRSLLFSEYAVRHWQEASSSGKKGHYAIALIEFIPVLGAIASLIERIAFKIWNAHHPQNREKAALVQIKQESPYLLSHQDISATETTLLSIQNKIAKRGIPLHVLPDRPTQSYPLKTAKVNEFRDLLNQPNYIINPENGKELLNKALDHLQHISMDQLDEQLKICVEILNEELNRSGKYAVGLVVGKSFQWIASLALKHLQFLPEDWFSFPVNLGITSFLETQKPLEEVVPEVAVIFDDCSYSGNQILGVLKALDGKKKKLILVIPFMTQGSVDRVEEFKKNAQSKIILITSPQKIISLSDVFNPDELTSFNKITIDHPEWDKGSLFSLEGQYLPGQTLCYTDWRLPDNTSYLTTLGDGLMKFLGDDTWKSVGSFNYSAIPRPYQVGNSL